MSEEFEFYKNLSQESEQVQTAESSNSRLRQPARSKGLIAFAAIAVAVLLLLWWKLSSILIPTARCSSSTATV